MPISPARIAAFDALLKIELRSASTSEILPIVESELSDQDRGLCHKLVLDTLRRQIYLDRIIDHLANSKSIDVEIRIILRLGLVQLKFLDRVPDYSAINECVELVRRIRKRSATGFVNALLRRASREKIELQYDDDTDMISVETSHPRWLIERWILEFGKEAAYSSAKANNIPPRVAFRKTAILADDGNDGFIESFEKSQYVPGCFLADGFTNKLKDLEERGLLYFQDEASQLAASSMEIAPDDLILDLCAAPGSKTGMIAKSVEKTVFAGDNSLRRLELLTTLLEKQGVSNVRLCRYDAENPLPFADNTFDKIFADVPCSGTGTIRHNPEIRYRLTENDIQDQAGKQLRIVENASNVLKPGGTMVYSTCSLERDENEGVILNLMSLNSNLVIERPNVPDSLITNEGFARTWPSIHDMDGFFIAVLKDNRS